MSADGKLKRFGRYLLFDHLVDGGMAKICRARFLDVDKMVAIKMIQSQFSEDENFKKMFLDEIKLTFALNHPNIAQIYDYGFYHGQLYTAMELVEGKNLKQFLERLKKKNYVFPIEISVYIISQVCQGLRYAHNFRDKLSAKKLNIIHRDISPHNVMLSFDGVIKIIDFGIAKTNSSEESTEAGVIKGKLSYLAPEYISGEELDHRYDQFAVGVTLWELLCSRKLFTAKNGFAILKEIQRCKVPRPSHINPNVPKELDEIVMKALARERENRFEDMDQLNRELVKFLHAHYPQFNPMDISSFAQTLFKDEIKKDRAKLFEFGKIDIALYLQEWKGEMSREEDDESSEGDFSVHKLRVRGKSREGEGHFYLCDVEDIDHNIQAEGIDFSGPKKRRRKRLKPEEVKKEVPLTYQRKGALARGKHKIIRVAGMLAIIFGIAYSERESFLNSSLGKSVTKILPSLSSGDAKRGLASVSEGEKRGTLRLKGFRKSYHTLLVNGEPAEYDFFFIRLPFGKHRVEVARAGRKSFIKEFELTEGNPEVRFEIEEMPMVIMGEIYSSRSHPLPEGTTLELVIDNREVQQRFPFDGHRVPAGSYRGVVKNVRLGIRKEVRFVVEEGKRTEIAIDIDDL